MARADIIISTDVTADEKTSYCSSEKCQTGIEVTSKLCHHQTGEHELMFDVYTVKCSAQCVSCSQIPVKTGHILIVVSILCLC